MISQKLKNLLKKTGPLAVLLKWLKKVLIELYKSIDYLIWLSKAYIQRALQGESVKKTDHKDVRKDKIKVAFVVTEVGEQVTAGDYFTACELGQALEKLGWEVTFIEKKQKKCYEISDDIDIIISMLETYDIRRIGLDKPHIVKVAWARNWFESWTNQPYINKYDVILASSEKAVTYMATKLRRKVFLMKIGTNTQRFEQKEKQNVSYQCDYCFTGSYWKEPREIIDALSPSELEPYQFHLYGANWEQVAKFQVYNKGFVSYKDMPTVYNNTKILIDDANRVTKPFGSVNSRVFDALSSGTLVLTNGELGARNTFGELLPTYSTAQDLQEQIRYFLENEKERHSLVTKLQADVRENHSYDCRAKQLIEILSQYMR